MGRASSIASCPPCGIGRGSSSPMENSPPGTHVIPAGGAPDGFAAFAFVGRKPFCCAAANVATSRTNDADRNFILLILPLGMFVVMRPAGVLVRTMHFQRDGVDGAGEAKRRLVVLAHG